MIVVEDIKDKLYWLDNNRWGNCICELLKLLDYPVTLSKIYGCNEYIYVVQGPQQFCSAREKRILSQCDEITIFDLDASMCWATVIACKINDATTSRNEVVCDITKVFRNIYGPHIFCVFINNGEVIFSGVSNNDNGRRDVIISEWFGYNKSDNVNNQMIDISLSLLSIKDTYSDYLWAISREYMKILESNYFLQYGCDTFVEIELLLGDEEGNCAYVSCVDYEETMEMNRKKVVDQYGDDYYDIQYENDTNVIFDDKTDYDEWTLLELEMSTEQKNEIYDYVDELEEDEEQHPISDLNGLNPEEMIEYIRNNDN